MPITPAKWQTASGTLTQADVLNQASRLTGKTVTDVKVAARILEDEFVAFGKVAVADGKLSDAEKGQLGTGAFFATGAQGLAAGGASVTFSTSVSVENDGSVWFSGSLNKQPTPTVNDLLRGLTGPEQIAKQQQLEKFRTVVLGNESYILKDGDNLSTIAQKLILQSLAQDAAVTTEATCPWLKTGFRFEPAEGTPNGPKLNLEDENKYIKACGGWSGYVKSDRFKLRLHDYFQNKVAAEVPATVSLLASKNQLANVNAIQMGAILTLPSAAELSALRN